MEFIQSESTAYLFGGNDDQIDRPSGNGYALDLSDMNHALREEKDVRLSWLQADLTGFQYTMTMESERTPQRITAILVGF